MEKVYIKGVPGHGTNVIAKLKSLGAENIHNCDGENPSHIYFINPVTNAINETDIDSASAVSIMWAATEIMLNEDEMNSTLNKFDPVMVSDDGNVWCPATYINDDNVCFDMDADKDVDTLYYYYKYVVPYNKFDFNDLPSNIIRSI